MTKHTLVNIPSKNVYIAKRGKYLYVFHILDTGYNPELKKRNQPVLTSIGKPVDEKYMIPNDNYFKIYNVNELLPPPLHFSDRMSIGCFLLINHAAKSCGCLKALKSVFPNIYHKLYAFAQYMLVKNTSNEKYFEDFAYFHYCGLSENIYPPEWSEIFKSEINKDNIDLYFTRWIKIWKQIFDKTSKNEEYLIYLLPSNDEDGYGQINTAIFVSRQTNHLLGMCQYFGKEVDDSIIEDLISYGKSIGLQGQVSVANHPYSLSSEYELIPKIASCKEVLAKKFIEAIALIIKNELLILLKPYFDNKENSSQTLGSVLSLMRRVEVSYDNKWKLHYQFSSDQLTILDIVGINEKDISATIKEMSQNIKL